MALEAGAYIPLLFWFYLPLDSQKISSPRGAWIFGERAVFVFDLMRRIFDSILSGWLFAPTVYLYVLLLSARRGKMYVCLLLLFR